MAFDDSGDLFVSDPGDWIIIEYANTAGTLSTTPQHLFRIANTLMFDSSGNLFARTAPASLMNNINTEGVLATYPNGFDYHFTDGARRPRFLRLNPRPSCLLAARMKMAGRPFTRSPLQRGVTASKPSPAIRPPHPGRWQRTAGAICFGRMASAAFTRFPKNGVQIFSPADSSPMAWPLTPTTICLNPISAASSTNSPTMPEPIPPIPSSSAAIMEAPMRWLLIRMATCSLPLRGIVKTGAFSRRTRLFPPRAQPQAWPNDGGVT